MPDSSDWAAEEIYWEVSNASTSELSKMLMANVIDDSISMELKSFKDRCLVITDRRL